MQDFLFNQTILGVILPGPFVDDEFLQERDHERRTGTEGE
jgi:hypothetical protein